MYSSLATMDYQWIYLCNTCVALCIILPDLKYTSLSSIFSFIFLFSAFSNCFFLSFSAFGFFIFPLFLFLSQVHYIQIFLIFLSFLCIFMYTLIFSFILNLIWNLFLYSFFVITIYIVKCSSYVSSEPLFYFVHEFFLSSCSFLFLFSFFHTFHLSHFPPPSWLFPSSIFILLFICTFAFSLSNLLTKWPREKYKFSLILLLLFRRITWDLICNQVRYHILIWILILKKIIKYKYFYNFHILFIMIMSYLKVVHMTFPVAHVCIFAPEWIHEQMTYVG